MEIRILGSDCLFLPVYIVLPFFCGLFADFMILFRCSFRIPWMYDRVMGVWQYIDSPGGQQLGRDIA